MKSYTVLNTTAFHPPSSFPPDTRFTRWYTEATRGVATCSLCTSWVLWRRSQWNRFILQPSVATDVRRRCRLFTFGRIYLSYTYSVAERCALTICTWNRTQARQLRYFTETIDIVWNKLRPTRACYMYIFCQIVILLRLMMCESFFFFMRSASFTTSIGPYDYYNVRAIGNNGKYGLLFLSLSRAAHPDMLFPFSALGKIPCSFRPTRTHMQSHGTFSKPIFRRPLQNCDCSACSYLANISITCS